MPRPSFLKERAATARSLDAPPRAVEDPAHPAVRPAVAETLRAQRALGNQAAVASSRPGSALSEAAPAGGLVLGSPGDRHEREADRVADALSRRLSAPGASPHLDAPAPTITAAPSGSAGGAPVSADLEEGITAKRGSGSPAPPGLRPLMDRALGPAASALRFHVDAESEGLARSLDAPAFTVGQDLFFQRGAFSPDSAAGRGLIFHEAAHAMQQGPEGTLIQRGPKDWFRRGKKGGGKGATASAAADTTSATADTAAEEVTLDDVMRDPALYMEFRTFLGSHFTGGPTSAADDGEPAWGEEYGDSADPRNALDFLRLHLTLLRNEAQYQRQIGAVVETYFVTGCRKPINFGGGEAAAVIRTYQEFLNPPAAPAAGSMAALMAGGAVGSWDNVRRALVAAQRSAAGMMRDQLYHFNRKR